MTYSSIFSAVNSPSLIDKAEELTTLEVGHSLSPHSSVMDFIVPFLQWISSPFLSHGIVLQQYLAHVFHLLLIGARRLFPHLHHIVDSP